MGLVMGFANEPLENWKRIQDAEKKRPEKKKRFRGFSHLMSANCCRLV
jgi:hypothetical protein